MHHYNLSQSKIARRIPAIKKMNGARLTNNNTFLFVRESFFSITFINFPQSPQITNQETLYPYWVSMILRKYTNTLASMIKLIQINCIVSRSPRLEHYVTLYQRSKSYTKGSYVVLSFAPPRGRPKVTPKATPFQFWDSK